MSLDNIEDSVKVIVVGDGSVGKTSMLRRYVKGEFTDQYKKTIGAEYMEKEVYVRELNQSVGLMLWDTAGQEVFNALTASYYRGAGAAVLAFSTTDRDSFANVEKWKTKVEAKCGSIAMVLCQTKCDLLQSSQAAVTEEEADALAQSLQLPLYRISTKQNVNVNEVFELTAKLCLLAGATDGGLQQLHTSATEKRVKLHEGTEGAKTVAVQDAPMTERLKASRPTEQNSASVDPRKGSGTAQPVNLGTSALPKKKKLSFC